MTLLQHLQFYLPVLGEFNGLETKVELSEDFKRFAERTEMTMYERNQIIWAMKNAALKFLEANAISKNLHEFSKYVAALSGADTSYEEYLVAELVSVGVNVSLELDFNLVFNLPAIGDVVKHHSGREYEILAVYNTTSTNVRYQPTVSYKNVISKETFCKDIYNFNRTFNRG